MVVSPPGLISQENGVGDPVTFYHRWISAFGLPMYRGHFIEDLRTLELGHWEERGCNAAFLLLEGQEYIQEVRVIEIPPGATLPPFRLALEEEAYVLQGRGQTTLWGADGLPRKSFEWQERSVFMIPPNYSYQLSSLQGDRPARLLITNFLPVALALYPNLDFFLNSQTIDFSLVYGAGNPYAEAKSVPRPEGDSTRQVWIGNFFPDLSVWDKLEPFRQRGAGGHMVSFRSKTGRGGHMSVFPVGTYKKGHRHGAGRVIFIVAGEGMSIIWPEGGEKTILHWHEGSMFVPPNQWFHQHFNIGAIPARYVAFSPPRGNEGPFESGEDSNVRQIDYVDEEPWIRKLFEEELAKPGVRSQMPDECYRERNYQWKYAEDE